MEAIPFLRSLPDPNATVSLADTTTGGRVSLPDKNPIMALNEIAMSHGQTLVWGDGNVYGPPHQRRYEYTVTLAGHEAKGSGQNKKTAKAAAAVYLLAMLPPELRAPAPKKKQGKKRKAAAAATGAAAAAGTEAKMIGPQIPGKIAKNSVSGMKVFEVIENANPISALHEYCMKGKEKVYKIDREWSTRMSPRYWLCGIKASNTFRSHKYVLHSEVVNVKSMKY